MHIMNYVFDLGGSPLKGNRCVCGVVGSGNLEVIAEQNNSSQTEFIIQTPVENFQALWQAVIEAFTEEYQPVGVRFTLNDNGATPAVVSLRLRQALENFQGYQHLATSYLELGARERITALVDYQSFKEWLAEKPLYSPHLIQLNLPCEADDGLVCGEAMFHNRSVLIAAQQKDFMGGAVGEIHGAKLTGLFKAALHKKVKAVILLIDSGGVRLHEANAGEIAISETIRAILAARQQGIATVGVVCGKNGAFGGMGIISACLDHLIVNELARIGVSGPEVIQAVKGVETFDAQDRALVWRVYGGKTRYLQGMAQNYIDDKVASLKAILNQTLTNKRGLDLASLQKEHALLKQQLHDTAGYEEEGTYLAAHYPQFASTLFEMNKETFLQTAPLIKQPDREDK